MSDSEKEEKYQEALAKEKAGDYAADEIYYSLWDYKDCEDRHDACLGAIEEAEDAAREERRKRLYQDAIQLEEAGSYAEAMELYDELDDYEDSPDRLLSCKQRIGQA